MARAKKAREPKPQEQKKHPDEWQRDLNPDRMAGQNIGAQNSQDLDLRSAAAIKELTECLSHFSSDELAQISIVPKGGRLQQGGVYLDLLDPASGPITATGDIVAQEHHLYVAKDKTPYPLWNRLVEVACPVSAAQARGTEEPGVYQDLIDQTLADSFPASDPPFWTTGREPKEK